MAQEENKNEEEKKTKKKDPYFKPVILGGLTITFLSIVFAPGIFIWSVLGGYVAVRLSYKFTKEVVNLKESLLLGLFSGLVGSTCLNLMTAISFRSPENKRMLIQTLEKNWPQDVGALPNFAEMLPSVFFATCLILVVITIVFALIGSYIGLLLCRRSAKKKSV